MAGLAVKLLSVLSLLTDVLLVDMANRRLVNWIKLTEILVTVQC